MRTQKWKLELSYPDETIFFDNYEEAARILGIRPFTLQTYLARGKGSTNVRVWNDALEQEIDVKINRRRIDPRSL